MRVLSLTILATFVWAANSYAECPMLSLHYDRPAAHCMN